MKNIVVPSKKTAVQLFCGISEKLWQSFKYILEVSHNQHTPFCDLIQRMSKNDKPSPFFFAAHHILANHYGPSSDLFDESIIQDILSFKDYVPIKAVSIMPYYRDPTKVQEEAIRLVVQQDRFTTYPKNKLDPDYQINYPINSAKYKASAAIAYQAMDIIKKSNPDLFEEIQFIVDELRIFRAVKVRAGTCFNTLGMIYIAEISEEEDVSRYIEHIVHEAAHNLLYAHWAMQPILLDETDELFYTPFRKDHRPMSAIYHAMFVLCRTIYAFDSIWRFDNSIIDLSKIRTNYNEQGNDTPFKIKFQQTVAVISNNASLSRKGQEILDACCALVDKTIIDI